MKAFIDTGALVATALSRDAHHVEATAIWRRLAEQRASLVTTDWVLGETVTFLRRRAGYEVAKKVGESVRTSNVIETLNPSPDLVDRAWAEFLEHPFPDLSMVDALSFVVMRGRRLRHVFAFDDHFVKAGFELLG